MNIWLYALLTWVLVAFLTSYAKSRFSWTKTKSNWVSNHKATVVSMGLSLALTAIAVATGGFSVPTVITIVAASSLSEIAFNRG